MSSPNQRIVQIEKPKYEKNFLQIGENEWIEAFTRLKPSAFGIYLYLANNANGYKLELSQKAVENKLGITDSVELSRIEERISKKRAIQLFESGYLDSLEVGTLNTLSKIHSYLFGDIYNFSGKVNIRLSK